jgi:predicted TPR repeat methyltransferase
MANQNEAARALFQKAVELAPGDAEHLRKWAQFEKKAGEEADVRRIFQKSIEAGPTVSRIVAIHTAELKVGTDSERVAEEKDVRRIVPRGVPRRSQKSVEVGQAAR